jgi:hypothetical protein
MAGAQFRRSRLRLGGRLQRERWTLVHMLIPEWVTAVIAQYRRAYDKAITTYKHLYPLRLICINHGLFSGVVSVHGYPNHTRTATEQILAQLADTNQRLTETNQRLTETECSWPIRTNGWRSRNGRAIKRTTRREDIAKSENTCSNGLSPPRFGRPGRQPCVSRHRHHSWSAPSPSAARPIPARPFAGQHSIITAVWPAPARPPFPLSDEFLSAC